MRATVPVTCGAAMLVPVMRVHLETWSASFLGAERAANTETPGAHKSGFSRPSRVGPTLLKGPMECCESCALYAPTAIVRRPLQIVPVVDRGSASSGLKCD